MTLDELIKRKELEEGFTLPEVFIALVVIGIISALTIPAMIANTDRREWIASLNKSYSLLSEGFKEAEAIHGSVRLWGDKFVENLIGGFKVLSPCTDNDCIDGVRYLNGEDNEIPENSESYVLADGQTLTLHLMDNECLGMIGNLDGVCGTAFVDINGPAKPNVWGKDYFGFYVTRDGIIPFGTQKIDVLAGFTWIRNGCHTDEKACTNDFSCADYATNETVCNTCGGAWSVTYADAYVLKDSDLGNLPQVVGVSYSVVATEVNTYKDVYSSYTCVTGYGSHCDGYDMWGCTGYSGYTDYGTCYYVSGYTPATYKIKLNQTTLHCDGSATDSVCLSYKFTQIYDCWYDDNNEPYDDECNEYGTASKTSCELKSTDALEDCNLEGEGTSCASWAIVNGNMIYLDGKEISW